VAFNDPCFGGEDKLDENASPPATYLRRKIPMIHLKGESSYK